MTFPETTTPSNATGTARQYCGDDPFDLDDIPDFLRRTPSGDLTKPCARSTRLFVNHYRCPRCKETWQDEWSCACNDECPGCGLKDIEPHRSDTVQVMERN